jgi:hypothetical protein
LSPRPTALAERGIDRSVLFKLSGRQIPLCNFKKTSSREDHKTVFSALTTFSGTAISLCRKNL